jgi:DNA-directed RNA polymerase specialized sigma24 family protein
MWRVEMATTTATSAIRPTASGLATADEIRAAFTEHREELAWLAGFLTGDEMVAAACIIDARKLAQNEGKVVQEWLWTSARDATIRSALDVQQVRIGQLSSVYDRCDCVYGEHAALPLEMLEFLVRESDEIRLRLDSICRFVLVLRGIENRLLPEVALLLGISEHAVEAAYCAALQSIDVIRSQAIVGLCGYAAAYN